MINESRLVDTRQILYFVTCVKAGSFSKAAGILHSTQPSVSKVVKSMEDMLEVKLFERYAKGIVLTREGEKVYHYAQAVLEKLEMIQDMDEENIEERRLLVSCNPSSWFADRFLEYYRLHSEKKDTYTVYSASTSEIAERIRDRVDDLGFVYVMKKEQPAFSFFLEQNYLEMEVLAETEIMLFSGDEIPKKEGVDLSGMKLVQRFADEFSAENYWDIQDSFGNSAADARTVVTTNSDYIMERLLRQTDLVNISSRRLSEEKEMNLEGTVLSQDTNGKILFCCIRRRGEQTPECAQEFLEFLKKTLISEK